MNILFLAQRVPYPPNRGDKITTWRLIERMRRSHEVTCLAFAHDDADFEAAATLNERGIPTRAFALNDKLAKLSSLPLFFTSTPLTLGVYGSRALQRELDRIVAKFDVAYAYSSSMGAFLEKHSQLPRVMHFAELDSDKWRQYAEHASWPMSWVYRREARTLLEFERRIARSFSENVFCTPIEQRIFQGQIPGASSIVLRNGVDLDAYQPSPQTAEPGHLVFVGVMDYFPNVDGCVHFAHEVLPRVRRTFPAVRFTIVGSRPTSAVRALARIPGVTVTGFVDDPRDFLCRATISVAPLRIARGIQNKVLEAMAMGLPVVGTTAATQGIEGSPERDFLVADGVEQQAAAVCRLLGDAEAAKALGLRGREFVESRYRWDLVLQPLDALLQRLVETRA